MMGILFFLARFAFVFSGSLCVLYAWNRFVAKKQTSHVELVEERLRKRRSKVEVVLLGLLMLLTFAVVSLTSYLSWPSGDEWMWMARCDLPVLERIRVAVGFYHSWCSRLPEIIGNVGGLHRNCWQDWVITPILVVIAPFFVWRLVGLLGGAPEAKMPVEFYLLTSACFLLISSCYYTSYNFNITHVYPTIVAIYLMSVVFTPSKRWISVWRTVACWSLGVFCGWGNECLAQGLILMVGTYIMWQCVRNHYVGMGQLALYLGILSGAYMLFSSPALEMRSAPESSLLASMSEKEVLNFLANLDWDKVRSLAGGAAFANLTDVPFLLRAYFVPYSLALFVDVATVPLILFVLLLCFAVAKRCWGVVGVACIMMLISLEMAVAFVAGALPNFMAYIPAAVVVVCACAYLYSRVSMPLIFRRSLALILFAYALYIYVPDICVAMRYKQFDREIESIVKEQSSSGAKHITLPPVPELKELHSKSSFYGIPACRRIGLGAYNGPLKQMTRHNLRRNNKDPWDTKKVSEYYSKWYPIESIEREW